jgi:type III secretory pathway component EscS
MTDPILVQLVQEALVLVAVVVAPPVGAALTVGLLIGVVQAVTQVQDQALSLAFRIAAILGTLLLAGPWIFDRVARFAARVFDLVAA